jgi:hypothetical protein
MFYSGWRDLLHLQAGFFTFILRTQRPLIIHERQEFFSDFNLSLWNLIFFHFHSECLTVNTK